MPKRLTKSDLLDFVEGTMDPRLERKLRRMLDERPVLKARLEGMIADRAAIRALTIPTLERDLVSALLAPPSIDGASASGHVEGSAVIATVGPAMPSGASLRVRPRSTIRWTAAAGVLLALTIGVQQGVRAFRPATPTTVATDDRPTTAEAPLGPVEAPRRQWTRDELLQADAIVHHAAPRLPGLGDAGRGAVDDAIASASPRRTASFDANGSVAIVIESSDRDAVVRRLAELVDRLSGESALVRNLSLDDVLAAQRRLDGLDLAPPPGLPEIRDARASGRGGAASRTLDESGRRIAPQWTEWAEWADWIESVGRVAGGRAISADELRLGEHLAGPRGAAPRPTLQLELAEDGYGYAIAGTPREVSTLLAAVAAMDVRDAWIAPRGDEADRAAVRSGVRPTPLVAIDRWRRWASLVEVDDGSNGPIVVPITIRVVRSAR